MSTKRKNVNDSQAIIKNLIAQQYELGDYVNKYNDLLIEINKLTIWNFWKFKRKVKTLSLYPKNPNIEFIEIHEYDAPLPIVRNSFGDDGSSIEE